MSAVFIVFIYFMVTEVLGLAPSESPASKETGNSFFNDAEKELINQYCKTTELLRDTAVKLKDSLTTRGIFDANTTEKDVLGNKRFMRFLKDVMRLNINSNDRNFGTVTYNGTSYPICTDFELSDDAMKPLMWQQKFPDLPNAVFLRFKKNRDNLLRKVDRDSENFVNHMGFIRPPKATPTKEAESKESVQGRVNEFMVRLFDMY